MGRGKYFGHSEFNARGFAILIPKSINKLFVYKNGLKDNNGRFLLINCQKEGNPFTLIYIYSPSKDNIPAQINFLESILSWSYRFRPGRVYIGQNMWTIFDLMALAEAILTGSYCTNRFRKGIWLNWMALPLWRL